MLFKITYHPHLQLAAEIIEADEVAVEGEANLVLRGTVLVMGQPRTVVSRRLRAADVLSVDPAG